ncbi:hypothetical protein H0H81_002462 [Sphagnurus paluster]|uniref:Threonine/serine exporter-like N-terminal domain-containing protein n=1 Tax=Sphagnurus paluster TaxID=117069 RepID=A0A9P7FNL9_9AGAR|nr:hypothetical protein H0H81_002462 [Sphagnurus paluster]
MSSRRSSTSEPSSPIGSEPSFRLPPRAAPPPPRREPLPQFSQQTPSRNPYLNSASPSRTTPQPQYPEEPQWQVPIYDNNTGEQSPEEFPRHDSLVPPFQRLESESRRGSSASDATLNNFQGETDNAYKKYSLSSYEHPYDIQPPQNAYPGHGVAPLQPRPKRSAMRRGVSFSEEQPEIREYEPTEKIDPEAERALKRRGLPSNILDLYTINASSSHGNGGKNYPGGMRREYSEANSEDYGYSSGRFAMDRRGSMASMTSMGSEPIEPDDPRVTGIEAKYLEDPEDVEKNALRQMDYRARRKHLTRIRIEFNVTSMINRQEFLIKLAKALMTFGAPSHRIESQLVAAARILEVEAEFIHLPSVIICSFGDQELGCSETHFVKCGGRLSLGALHKVHLIYRSVVHDEISAKRATADLESLLNAPPLYPIWCRCILAFSLSALICPLAFGGSFLDLWIAGAGAFVLSILQLNVASKSVLYANGFGLQIGSDFYLLLDRQTRHKLDELADNLAAVITLTGSWVADNATVNNSIPLVGTWTFTHSIPVNQYDIQLGCYRPKSFPWYLQQFPSWTVYIIVPVFSTLSSLANLQPIKSKQLPVMVVISCASYASNKIANHYIFNRSDVVSAIGAFTVGLLGNIYSRKMGGTAFTSMVTGVLFLVPSGLSQAGGITANGNGIDIGGAMIAVTIGITVGLFMSQALVYAFGSRKNAAVFSF